MTIEFFITPAQGGYQLVNGKGAKYIDVIFATKEAAADMAVRFAQDQRALYAIHY